MTAKPVTPEVAAKLVAAGAVLIDVREPHERTVVIEGALSAPLSSAAGGREAGAGRPVIFHCGAGRRTEMNAEALAASVANGDVHLLQGGIEGWRAAGFPVSPRD